MDFISTCDKSLGGRVIEYEIYSESFEEYLISFVQDI